MTPAGLERRHGPRCFSACRRPNRPDMLVERRRISIVIRNAGALPLDLRHVCLFGGMFASLGLLPNASLGLLPNAQ
eukprot:5881180-Amphidinium_carterae.1